MIHDFPYTDLHELNLDWFLENFKKLQKELSDLKSKVAEIPVDTDLSDIEKEFESQWANRTLVKELDSRDILGMDGYYANSFTYCKDRNTYYVGFRPSASFDDQYNGRGAIVELNTSFEVIRRRFDAEYGRLNDLCYVDNILYAAPLYSGYATDHFNLVKIDPDNLTVIGSEYPVPNASICAVCYDSDNDTFYFDAAPSGSSDHYFYRTDGDFTNPVRLVNSFFYDRDKLVLQGMEFTGGRVIQIGNSRNPTGVTYFHTYKDDLDYVSAIDGFHCEPEGLAVKDNDLYLADIYRTYKLRIYKLQYSIEPKIFYRSVPGAVTDLIRPIVANENVSFTPGDIVFMKCGKFVSVRSSGYLVFSASVSSGVILTDVPGARGAQYGLLIAPGGISYNLVVGSNGHVQTGETVPAGSYRIMLTYMAS